VTFFVNGQPAGVWDGTDGQGNPVPEGLYQVKLEQGFTDGTSVRLTTQVSVTRTGSLGVGLSALPNLVYAGGSIQFTGTWAGSPVPDGTPLRVHALSGERVRTLPFAGGTAVWDLRNEGGREVASGIYLITLQAPKAGAARAALRTIKVVVLR
jgi:hypothetical protein